jgi:hypothetical protein
MTDKGRDPAVYHRQQKSGTKGRRYFGYVWGMTAAALFFVLSGCGEGPAGVEPYTFHFKVENKSNTAITGVQFFNGSHKSAMRLRYIEKKLSKGELSNEYTVFGFTNEYGTGERYCGVLVIYEDEDEVFAHGHFSHESKILITSNDIWISPWAFEEEIELSPGNW